MNRFVVAALIYTILIFNAIPAIAQQVQPDVNPKLLTVNDTSVYASDVSLVLSSLGRPQMAEQEGAERMVAAALKQVIETRLLSQEANRRGYKANQQRVAQALQAIEGRTGSREKLEANLKRAGTDYARLVSIIEERELVRELINRDIRPGISASEQEVNEFYSSNTELFVTPDQVKARHILFVVPPDTDQLKLDEIRSNAEAARKRAVAGEDFAKLAIELSEGPSGPKGGDLGFFSADQMVEPFAQAAFALKPGEISEPVKTQYGFHIIKVEERRPGGDKQPLEQVRQRIEMAIQQHKTTEAIKALLNSLLSQAKLVPLGDTVLPPDLFESAPEAE
jgi:parvulin-like peptidyl-prolyl isomerase